MSALFPDDSQGRPEGDHSFPISSFDIDIVGLDHRERLIRHDIRLDEAAIHQILSHADFNGQEYSFILWKGTVVTVAEYIDLAIPPSEARVVTFDYPEIMALKVNADVLFAYGFSSQDLVIFKPISISVSHVKVNGNGLKRTAFVYGDVHIKGFHRSTKQEAFGDHVVSFCFDCKCLAGEWIVGGLEWDSDEAVFQYASVPHPLARDWRVVFASHKEAKIPPPQSALTKQKKTVHKNSRSKLARRPPIRKRH